MVNQIAEWAEDKQGGSNDGDKLNFEQSLTVG
jgi:hypothetical protein